MKKEKYLESAPNELINVYESMCRVLKNTTKPEHNLSVDMEILSKKADFYQKLLTRVELKATWKTLKKWELKRIDRAFAIRLHGPGPLAYANAVWSALHEKPSWEELTPREREETASCFIKDAKKLAFQAKRYGIGINILDLFSHHELTGLKLTAAGYGFESDREKLVEAEASLVDSPSLQFSQIKTAPSVDVLLERLIDQLSAAPLYSSAVLTQPGATNSDYIYFVRYVGRHNYDMYGTHIYGVIADTASVFFPNESPSEDSVRHILRGSPRTA